jgi:hypothetical protein
MASIAGHKTKGMPGKMWPSEKGMSVHGNSKRGQVKGGGLEAISSRTVDAKPRIGLHKKGS